MPDVKTYLQILKEESFSTILANIYNRIKGKATPYQVYRNNQVTLQFTKLYQSPVKFEFIGHCHANGQHIQSLHLTLGNKVFKDLDLHHAQNGFLFHHLLPFEMTSEAPINEVHVTVFLKDDSKFEFVCGLPEAVFYKKETVHQMIAAKLLPPKKKSPSSFSKLSFIIPFKDQIVLLAALVSQIKETAIDYNYELILLDNQSTEHETQSYLAEIRDREEVTVIHVDKEFNYAALMNLGSANASGETLVMMNNDIVIEQKDWLAHLLKWLHHEDIGVVGPKLLYPDYTVQHVGMNITEAHPMHAWKHYPNTEEFGMLFESRAFSAITGACMVVSKEVFDSVEGFDEALAVTLNDIDFCLKVGQLGLKILVAHEATLIHQESVTRGVTDTMANADRSKKEKRYFYDKWRSWIKSGDPYYDKKLSRKYPDYRLQ